MPPGGGLAHGSGATAEKTATTSTTSSTSASVSPAGPSSWPPKKPRSCVVCRSRKVRCDKQTPCSNCRRAGIACVVPANDRPPRWARRLDRAVLDAAAAVPQASVESGSGAGAGAAKQVMERLHNLEGLVRELSGQLEQARSAASQSPPQDQQPQETIEASKPIASLQNNFGRLVVRDSSQSRYVSSGFWSRVSDEIDGLKMDAAGLPDDEFDSSEDEDSPGKSSSTLELERAPSQRHAFMFGHNLNASAHDQREFRPLPSQIPFLLNTFAENVNLFLQIVHMPTVTKMVRDMRGSDMSSLTPANEALLFSIFYAAITSMEDDDVMTNFGSTKAELNLRYRLGLEHALANADFLNVPDLVLVQAFAIFLYLVRRHDSPRFVWMMTGLLVRMAQAIGLQRDGEHFSHLTPYEIEMRRRVWCAVNMLDIRASEDQGMEFTIATGSYDTKLPLNINDADISPETKVAPPNRQGVTDVSSALVSYELCETVRQMMTPKDGPPTLEHQTKLLDEIVDKLDRGYLACATGVDNPIYWAAYYSCRLVIGKLSLLIYLPTLFASPNEHFSDAVRSKLLVAGIEVAEYNHQLNAEQGFRQWRWIFQTYTHWYAIVYLLIEVSRREWSPIIERAWVALHSQWLIPAKATAEKNARIWVPLRKLMAQARRHREAELQRIRGNLALIDQLEGSDHTIPVPASSGPFPTGKGEELFLQHWRSLVTTAASTGASARTPIQDTGHPQREAESPDQNLPSSQAYPQHHQQNAFSNSNSASFNPTPYQSGSNPFPTTTSPYSDPLAPVSAPSVEVPTDWSGAQSIGPGFTPWLWPDQGDASFDMFGGMDVNMDLNVEGMDWNTWLASAQSTDLDMK